MIHVYVYSVWLNLNDVASLMQSCVIHNEKTDVSCKRLRGVQELIMSIRRCLQYHCEPAHPAFQTGSRFSMDSDMAKKMREDDCGLATILQPSEMTESEVALHEAARNNDILKIKTLLLQRVPERVDVNCRNNLDRTALHWAAAMGHCEAISALITLGADIDARDKFGMWPVLWTAWFGHLEALKTLVNMGAKRSVSNKQGMDIIHCAAQNNHMNVLNYVFESLEGIKLNNQDKNNQSPVHLAAEAGHIEVLEIFLKRKCDLATRDKAGNTALHLAAQEGRTDAAEKLLEAGALTGERNEEGKTALHLAAEKGHHQTVSCLLNQQANINVETVKEMTSLHLAVINGYTEVIDVLIEAGCELNTKNCQGNTPLHLSAFYNHPDACQRLVDAHCRLDHINQRNQTPLHIAVESGFGDVVEILLLARADILAKDKHGHTPLHMAARGSFTGIVDMLIQADRIRMTEECLAKEKLGKEEIDTVMENVRQPLSVRHPVNPHADQLKGVLFKLATKHFKPQDWKKLAMYWGFTQNHIKTIEHEYSGRLSYKEHGFRMMMIWLVGLREEENPLKVLYEALMVTGKKRLAENIRREINKQAEKPGERICAVS